MVSEKKRVFTHSRRAFPHPSVTPSRGLFVMNKCPNKSIERAKKIERERRPESIIFQKKSTELKKRKREKTSDSQCASSSSIICDDQMSKEKYRDKRARKEKER